MEIDQVTRMTELQSSSGTNMVLAGIVALFLILVLGIVVLFMRARLQEDREERKQERTERKMMFDRLVIGDGNGNKGLPEQFAAMRAENSREHDDIISRLDAGQSRMDGMDVRCARRHPEAVSS